MKAQRVIAFYPELVDILGSIHAAIYYQQLYYWSDKGTREDGFIYKSKNDIEEETKLTREQQDPIRKKLVDLGWLEIKLIKAMGVPTIHYKCLKDINIAISVKPSNGLVGNTLMETCETHLSSIHKITSEINTSASLSLESKNLNTVEREKWFEQFWTLYPKKAGKKPAQASWRKVKREDYQKVLDALARHRKSEQWTKNNGQFIPNATTWLNQERWDDEVSMNSERKEIYL